MDATVLPFCTEAAVPHYVTQYPGDFQNLFMVLIRMPTAGMTRAAQWNPKDARIDLRTEPKCSCSDAPAVSTLRRYLTRPATDAIDIFKALKWHSQIARSLVAKRFDWIEPGGLARGVVAEKDADRR